MKAEIVGSCILQAVQRSVLSLCCHVIIAYLGEELVLEMGLASQKERVSACLPCLEQEEPG